MTKSLTLFLVTLTITCAFAQKEGAWTIQTIPDATRYDDVFFINENTGWTAGGWNRLIHKTTDGGESWTSTGLTTNTKYLRCIEFMNESIGLCGSLSGSGEPASLFRTTDGGATWTDVAPNIPHELEGICGLAKADGNTIYGVGVWSEPAYVIKSTDKGLTWTFKDMSAHASSLIDAHFLDADHGFVTGSISGEVDGTIVVTGGVILYTEDGGETWTEKFRTNHLTDRVWKIQTPDNKHFYGSIESDFGNTRMLRSSDAGQTWEMITVDPAYSYIQVIGFIDSLKGWTGGSETLYETKNGGNTWQKIALGSTYNRFFKINEELAYMTGRKVYKFKRSLITGTLDEEPYDPIHHITVSPNPTEGKATVRITFGNPTMAHVYLYNTTGKVIRKIFDGAAAAGEKNLELDLTDQGTQSYLVIVQTNEGMISTKVLKK
jgi:photosystem II stability/assembly factor-like uncharacterized protein